MSNLFYVSASGGHDSCPGSSHFSAVTQLLSAFSKRALSPGHLDVWAERPAVQGGSCLKAQTVRKNKEDEKQGVVFNMNPAGQPDLKDCDPQEQPPAAANETS